MSRGVNRAAGCLAAVVVVALALPAAAVAQGNQWWHGLWRMDDVRQISDGAGVTVAVIDSGVDATVPELAGSVLPAIDLTTEGAAESGHGTRMASLIAARDTGRGMVGVAPGVSILPVDVTSDGTSIYEFFERVAEGIGRAVDNGAHVINISLGSVDWANGEDEYPCPPALVEAIRHAVAAQVVIVASAGNIRGGRSEAPGSCPGVLTVGAVDADLELWEDSHHGPYVDVAAPGVRVDAVSSGSEILTTNGTSVSTALVSGAVALARAQFPDASARELVTRVIGTAVDIGPAGPDDASGYGVVAPLGMLTLDVPQGVPNPAFDALEALPAATEGPPSARDHLRPQIPPAARGEPSAGWLLAVLAAMVAVMGALAVLVVVLLLTRGRSRTARHPTRANGE